MLEAFAERDARAGPTVQVTREECEQVATRTTRLEYAEELLLVDQKRAMRTKARNTYLDACMIPDDQSEQWVGGT
jgi:hypothetical protein